MMERLQTELGRAYQVIESIGQGGIGTVFLARETLTGDLVVVKIINENLSASDLIRARARTEARLMIAISRQGGTGSEFVLPVYHASFTGLGYMIMKYARGGTLAHHLEAYGFMHPVQAAQVCLQLLAALACAHGFTRNGVSDPIIHRDIKPENVLFLKDGTLQLADFGIARRQERGAHTYATRVNSTLGTSFFLPEEQRKAVDDIDGRADIHAVGAMLFALLKGIDDKFMRSVGVVTCGELIEDDRLDFSGIPPCMEAVIRKATMKNRDLRYSTVQEMRNALQQCVKNLPMPQDPFPEFGTALKVLEQKKASASSSQASSTRPPESFTGPGVVAPFTAVPDPADMDLATGDELDELLGSKSVAPFVKVPDAGTGGRGRTIAPRSDPHREAEQAADLHEAALKRKKMQKRLLVGVVAAVFFAGFGWKVVWPLFSSSPVTEPPAEVVEVAEPPPAPESVVELEPEPDPVVEAAPEAPPEPPKAQERRPVRREPTARETKVKVKVAPPPEPPAEVTPEPEQPPEPEVEIGMVRVGGDKALLKTNRLVCDGQQVSMSAVPVGASCSYQYEFNDTMSPGPTTVTFTMEPGLVSFNCDAGSFYCKKN